MNIYSPTANQSLLLDKGEAFRNNTIDMAIKINSHIDNKILLDATNIEIERNEGLRIHVFRKLFKWKNIFVDPYRIEEIKCINLEDKSKKEVEECIDDLCSKLIVLRKVKYPFEIYHIVAKDGDYILFRILHACMDAYAALLTLADIVKIYYSLLNKTELPDNLSSVEDYFINFEKNLESYKKKEKEDDAYFIEQCDRMGEPYYLGCEGGYDGKIHRKKYSVLRNHPCKYHSDEFDKEISDICIKYCKENNINLVSLFLAITEIYLSAVNNKFNDVSLFFTSNMRAKLSDKKLPFSTSSAIFFRRIINNEQSLADFIKEADSYYLSCLRHSYSYISNIMKYLLKIDMKNLNGRYDQMVVTYIPTYFDGLPEGIEIEPYWPKAKEASDFIVYFVILMNKNGSFNVFYRYLEDMLNLQDLVNFNNGIKSIIKEYLSNPNIKVDDIMNRIIREYKSC